ncbi:MAG: hypothetical protein QXR48_00550 [Candidatus Woesearchaeota archaeon]
MKKSIWIPLIILAIAGGIAYYFLKPAALPVSIENRQTLTEVCISMTKQMLSDKTNLPDTTAECTRQGLKRFGCEAALRNDRAYFTSRQLEKDCEQLALFEAVTESNDKRNCKMLENAVLREECLTMLS